MYLFNVEDDFVVVVVVYSLSGQGNGGSVASCMLSLERVFNGRWMLDVLEVVEAVDGLNRR